MVVDGDTYVGPDIMNLSGVTVFDQFRGNGGQEFCSGGSETKLLKDFKKKKYFFLVCLYSVVVDGDTYVGPDIMNLLGVTVFDQFRGNGGQEFC